MWLETGHLKGQVDNVAMDSKADDSDHFREFSRQHKAKMITFCRQDMDRTPDRKKTISSMKKRSTI